MAFMITGVLLDACVLGALSYGSAYGYELTQRTQLQLGISETALYPVLRRLLKEDCLSFYDVPYDGRNRRYYELTEKGMLALREYEIDWLSHKKNIDHFLEGSNPSLPDMPNKPEMEKFQTGGNPRV